MAAALDRRTLNRTLLRRQLLDERAPMAATGAIEHLVGLQGQAPLAPYVGLWTRLTDFDPAALGELVASGQVVRGWLMRSTVHMVTARDYAALRPVMRGAPERTFFSGNYKAAAERVDHEAVIAAARDLLAERPMRRPDVGRALAERWPEHELDVLGAAAAFLLPVVQVPPRGVWGRHGPATLTLFEELDEPDPAEAVRRYLRAFGPATVKDIAYWSGLTRMRALVDGMELTTIRGPDGAELLDVPGGELADPGVAVPPRFLPEYDNVLLSHADRTRIMEPGLRPPLPPGNGARRGTFLVDGFFAGTWRIDLEDEQARLTVEPHARLRRADARAVAEEGARLAEFAVPGAAGHDVSVTGP